MADTMSKILLLCFCFLVSSGFWLAAAEPPTALFVPLQTDTTWEKESSGDNITVYSRKVADSTIREVLAESIIDATPARILAALADYPNYPSFMPYVVESAVLESRAGETLLFQQLDFPWPISDRYYTIVLEVLPDPEIHGGYLIHWDLARRKPVKREGKGLELSLNRGGWRLLPYADGAATRVIYYIYTDPGGALPAWVSNMANKVAVPKVIEAVRQRIR